MNDYQVRGRAINGTYIDQIVVARSEKEANREFKNLHKGENIDVTEATLIRENVPATKQQERDTLEAIKKMVAELGPQSYLATAFDGCFEDAESNIENDFADSYKHRYMKTEEELGKATATAQKRIATLETELEKAKQNIEEMVKINDNLKATIKHMEQKAFTNDELTDLKRLAVSKRLTLEEEVKNAANRIVEAAENPQDAAFRNAVKDHRVAKEELEYCTALLKKLAEVSEQ